MLLDFAVQSIKKILVWGRKGCISENLCMTGSTGIKMAEKI